MPDPTQLLPGLGTDVPGGRRVLPFDTLTGRPYSQAT